MHQPVIATGGLKYSRPPLPTWPHEPGDRLRGLCRLLLLPLPWRIARSQVPVLAPSGRRTRPAVASTSAPPAGGPAAGGPACVVDTGVAARSRQATTSSSLTGEKSA
jgi:hypothetical protein